MNYILTELYRHRQVLKSKYHFNRVYCKIANFLNEMGVKFSKHIIGTMIMANLPKVYFRFYEY